MLTKDQRTLLKNVLEALNRLFDRDSTVVDVHALLVATATPLHGSGLASAFESPTRQLRDILQSDALPDRKRDLALDATDDLRKFVAEELRRDAIENPKGRHALNRGVARGRGPTA